MRFIGATLALALLAAASTAQDFKPTVDPEMAAALADLRAAQAAVDSLAAQATMEVVQVNVDTLWPDLGGNGLRLRAHRADPLGVEMVIPYDYVPASDQLLWKQAKQAVVDAGIPFSEWQGNPWVWAVHKVYVGRVCAVLSAVIAPPATVQEQ